MERTALYLHELLVPNTTEQALHDKLTAALPVKLPTPYACLKFVTMPTKASHINPFHILTPYPTQFRHTTRRYFLGLGEALSNRDVMEPTATPFRPRRLSTRSRFIHCCVPRIM